MTARAITQKLAYILQKGFIPSPGGALGAGAYVTRKEEKAANYMPDDGVII
jgi:hypothetical protein